MLLYVVCDSCLLRRWSNMPSTYLVGHNNRHYSDVSAEYCVISIPPFLYEFHCPEM